MYVKRLRSPISLSQTEGVPMEMWLGIGTIVIISLILLLANRRANKVVPVVTQKKEIDKAAPTDNDLRGATSALAGMNLVPLHRLPSQRYKVLHVGANEVIEGETSTGRRFTSPVQRVMMTADGDVIVNVAVPVPMANIWRLAPGKVFDFAQEDGAYIFKPV